MLLPLQLPLFSLPALLLLLRQRGEKTLQLQGKQPRPDCVGKAAK